MFSLMLIVASYESNKTLTPKSRHCISNELKWSMISWWRKDKILKKNSSSWLGLRNSFEKSFDSITKTVSTPILRFEWHFNRLQMNRKLKLQCWSVYFQSKSDCERLGSLQVQVYSCILYTVHCTGTGLCMYSCLLTPLTPAACTRARCSPRCSRARGRWWGPWSPRWSPRRWSPWWRWRTASYSWCCQLRGASAKCSVSSSSSSSSAIAYPVSAGYAPLPDIWEGAEPWAGAEGEAGPLPAPHLGQRGGRHPRRVVRHDPVDRGAVHGVDALLLRVADQVVKPGRGRVRRSQIPVLSSQSHLNPQSISLGK